MPYCTFDPFNKPMTQIVGEDLEVLRGVAEGWYVDYKRATLKPEQTAKHLSAFANQFGGWLFFGVEESMDRTAASFVGVHKTEVIRLLTTIREAASAHVNPPCFYEEKVIDGPCPTIGLLADQAIVVIRIPQGAIPPYVHSSGRIYRRVADHSDPKPETDRHVLDVLWERGRGRIEQLERMHSIRPKHVGVEIPVAHVWLFTDPTFERDFELLDFGTFKESLQGPTRLGLSMPMNTVHACRGGYVARQTKGNNPLGPVASFRWWHLGAARITLPLNIYTRQQMLMQSDRFRFARAFVNELDVQAFQEARICDLTDFLFALTALYNQMRLLLDSVKNKEPLHASILIENIHSVIPYIDCQQYSEEVHINGIPVVEEDVIQIPGRPIVDDLISLQADSTLKEDTADHLNAKRMIEIMPVFVVIFTALGLMNELKDIAKYKDLLDTARISSNQSPGQSGRGAGVSPSITL
jgi:hypothetical protein